MSEFCNTGSVSPIFIPLRSEYFLRFRSGSKNTEYRPYGPRWNERTCWEGRAVTLSRGYGKTERLKGRIKSFQVLACPPDPEAWASVYGDKEGAVAAITISDIEEVAEESSPGGAAQFIGHETTNVFAEIATALRQEESVRLAILGTIAAAMDTVRKIGPIYNWIVVKPGMRERLRANSTPGTVPRTLDGGMVIYEKQQVADSWAFADESLLRKYLAGELSELDLMHKCFDGAGCKPNITITNPSPERTQDNEQH